jgi:quinol monooxygenase YgiN
MVMQSSDDAQHEPDTVLVTMAFDALDHERVAAALARYVVLSRNHDGCVNIDLAASATVEGRFVVVAKWRDGAAQRAHMDSSDLVTLAQTVTPLLRAAPAIDLLEPISVHDLH